LFAHFGDDSLPLINHNASATEIAKWKKKKEVAECYKKVFENNECKRSPVLQQLFEKVFLGENNPSSLHIAFVMAIYMVLLDPSSQSIQANENTIKKKINYYMVRFINLHLKL
jgi:hypothetical protein